MNQDQLSSILEALRAECLGEYEALAAVFVKAHSKDALWSALGGAHGGAARLRSESREAAVA